MSTSSAAIPGARPLEATPAAPVAAVDRGTDTPSATPAPNASPSPAAPAPSTAATLADPMSVAIGWDEGTWTNDPAAIEKVGSRLRVTAVAESDAWRETGYDFIHDTEHALVRTLPIGRAVEVRFVCQLAEQFDQAGVFLRIDDRRKNQYWVKAGVEHADGVDMLGAVVTNKRSDWSVSPVPEWSGHEVTIRLSRASDSVTIRARADEGPWRLVRLAPVPADAGASAGPMLCAPTRAGFTVEFVSWVETDADSSLH